MKRSRIGEIWREEGLRGIVDRVVRKIYRRTNLYQLTISENIGLPEASGLMFAAMTETTLAKMIQDYPEELSEDKRRRLASRLAPDTTDRVFLVTEGEETILGFYCSAYDSLYDDTMNYRVPARPGNVFFFDGYTFLAHRNKGAQKFATMAMLVEGRRRGCTTASTMVDEGNTFSEKAVARSGFTKAAVIHHFDFRLFKLNFQRELNPAKSPKGD